MGVRFSCKKICISESLRNKPQPKQENRYVSVICMQARQKRFLANSKFSKIVLDFTSAPINLTASNVQLLHTYGNRYKMYTVIKCSLYSQAIKFFIGIAECNFTYIYLTECYRQITYSKLQLLSLKLQVYTYTLCIQIYIEYIDC